MFSIDSFAVNDTRWLSAASTIARLTGQVADETVARRTALSLLLAAAGCGLAGCRSKSAAYLTEEEPPRMASVVMVGEPQATPQLVSGWYEGAPKLWRWTGPRFAALLGTPRDAARNGALLKFNFTLPDALVSQLKTVTLGASIQGTLLEPETYNRPGNAVYARDVPAALLSGDSCRVDFWVDKAFLPGGADRRELGVVAVRLALESR
jgi:hypothetical protein